MISGGASLSRLRETKFSMTIASATTDRMMMTMPIAPDAAISSPMVGSAERFFSSPWARARPWVPRKIRAGAARGSSFAWRVFKFMTWESGECVSWMGGWGVRASSTAPKR